MQIKPTEIVAQKDTAAWFDNPGESDCVCNLMAVSYKNYLKQFLIYDKQEKKLSWHKSKTR